MRKPLSLASTLILGWALAAASGPGQAQSPTCTGTDHCADVRIAGTTITVPNVIVPGKDHQIDWIIRTPGYTFGLPPKPDGVIWKAPSSINSNGAMPSNEFRCNRATATVYHCSDANSTHGTGVRSYQYKLTVIDPAGNPVVLDPWIVNQ